MSSNQLTSTTFEVRTVPRRGLGLFVLIDIPQGKRIANETPFFTLPNIDKLVVLEVSILRRLQALSSEQQQQVRSLHNIVEQEPALVGIVRTNFLGISPQIDAIFPTFSFINHSCVPNAHYSGVENQRRGNLYAVGDIRAGDEITINYGDHTRGHKGFQRSCLLCTSSLERRAQSDNQRDRIKFLQAQIIQRVESQHEACLEDLREMKEMSLEVYNNCAGTSLAWVYFTASQVAASQRFVCEGEQNPYVESYKSVRDNLKLHMGYGSTDFKETAVDMVPMNLGLEDFEDWLWTWE
ncbi:hypothetical protein DL95DRAFT_454516 [Leptodontidium sp. 2 PMI_412]|nr:hypothetical protein DL95DRAFT_454516 [Leptodontidium sp. 2 PMI_412]